MSSIRRPFSPVNRPVLVRTEAWGLEAAGHEAEISPELPPCSPPRLSAILLDEGNRSRFGSREDQRWAPLAGSRHCLVPGRHDIHRKGGLLSPSSPRVSVVFAGLGRISSRWISFAWLISWYCLSRSSLTGDPPVRAVIPRSAIPEGESTTMAFAISETW